MYLIMSCTRLHNRLCSADVNLNLMKCIYILNIYFVYMILYSYPLIWLVEIKSIMNVKHYFSMLLALKTRELLPFDMAWEYQNGRFWSRQ